MIFLDVGAHVGQTLREVLKPEYGFDHIYAFEPMPVQHMTLVRLFHDRRLSVLQFGLSDQSALLPVYGSNEEMESSLYADKRDVDPLVVTRCLFAEASSWFRENIAPWQWAIMKLNCEGSEVAILNNLIDTGEIDKVGHVMIDFDVRKIPGMEGQESELLERLASIGFDRYSLSEEVLIGETHQERIAHWLKGIL